MSHIYHSQIRHDDPSYISHQIQIPIYTILEYCMKHEASLNLRILIRTILIKLHQLILRQKPPPWTPRSLHSMLMPTLMYIRSFIPICTNITRDSTVCTIKRTRAQIGIGAIFISCIAGGMRTFDSGFGAGSFSIFSTLLLTLVKGV